MFTLPGRKKEGYALVRVCMYCCVQKIILFDHVGLNARERY